MTMEWGLLSLLVVAVGLGFLLGKRAASKEEDDTSSSLLAPHYLRGLNYFLNDQEDEAIDTFIHALDVNSETLETHLALGNLLRKRGEVGRAIKVHRNLLARPGLPLARSQQVQLELARDFVKSGLLDRAEVLLQELVNSAQQQSVKVKCLNYLIEIYRDEKEWLQGIDAINQLWGKRFSKMPETLRLIQSQFYCELAQQALIDKDYLACRRHLKAAITSDKESVRANLIRADLEESQGRHKDAIKSLKQVPFQDPAFVPEVLPKLTACYRTLGNARELKRYLEQLMESHSHPSVVLEMAEFISREEGKAEAVDFIAENISRTPSIKVAEKMLSMQLKGEGQDIPAIVFADQAIKSIRKSQPLYRCVSCGFGGRQLHWLCPGCQNWGTVKPAD